jgi:hypothetical protein
MTLLGTSGTYEYCPLPPHTHPTHLPTKEVDHPWVPGHGVRAAFDRTRDARSCEEARAEPVRSIIAAAASAATPCSPCGSVAILLFGVRPKPTQRRLLACE